MDPLTPEDEALLARLEEEEREDQARQIGERALSAVRSAAGGSGEARPFSLFRATVGALRDAGQGIIETIDDVGDSIQNATGIGGFAFGSNASNGVIEYLPLDDFNRRGGDSAFGRSDTNGTDNVVLPDFEGRAGGAESIVRGVGSYLIPFALTLRAIGGLRAATFLGRAWRGIAAGAAADFSQYDPV